MPDLQDAVQAQRQQRVHSFGLEKPWLRGD